MQSKVWRSVLLAGFATFGVAGIAAADGNLWLTEEWYAERACDPPGSRQIAKHGKLWPPYPRPVGRKQAFCHAFHYAHYWPYPHNLEDAGYTRTIIDQQSANGWVNATTLYDYHFDSETQQLTEVGKNHLLWISQSVPECYRTVYVAQGNSREVGQNRLANSDVYLREAGITNPPVIVARPVTFVGRPAREVELIRQSELNSIARQRLFSVGAAAGAGAGAMGGAGGAGAGTAPGAQSQGPQPGSTTR